VDGQSAEAYAVNLEANLRLLLDRAKSGTYRAPPVRRVYIPKGKGEMRPLGIPTFEDKVLQRAVAMVLEAVYEQEFFDCSYGFRPRRSAQQALDVVHGEAMRMSGGWVIELDIRKYFDTIDHEQVCAILRHRVRDGVILRLIGKWLHAGVMEDGVLSSRESGTPQGGVVSPILANISRRAVRSVFQWCKANRHAPLEMQQAVLGQKLRGHYGYYNCKGNRRRIWDFLYRAVCAWWHWLRHRSQRGLPSAAMRRLLRRYPLPKPPRIA